MAKQPDAAAAAETPELSNTVVTPAGTELTDENLGKVSGGDTVARPITNRPTIQFTSTTKDKVETFLEYP